MVNWNYVIPIASMLIVLLKVCPSKAGASALIPKLKLPRIKIVSGPPLPCAVPVPS